MVDGGGETLGIPVRHKSRRLWRRVLAQSIERLHSYMPHIFVLILESYGDSRGVRRRVLAQERSRRIWTDCLLVGYEEDESKDMRAHELTPELEAAIGEYKLYDHGVCGGQRGRG